MIKFKLIINILGFLLMLVACFMPAGIPFSLFYGDNDIFAIFIAAAITFLTGLILWGATGFRSRADYNELRKREGYVIVTLGWIVISAFGALPFVIHGAIPSYTDAYFETISGFTTTGASIMNNIESTPHGLLFWRSMTHWLGGMGIIVLSLAVLPLLGVGGTQLFTAEMAGPTKDKIHPQVQGTAKRLWGIYVIITGAETFLLMLGGMNLFEALCHAFGTMATGGFSTKQDSIAYYQSPFIQYVIIIFMFLAGTNFTLHYHALHGRLWAYLKDEEFRWYLITCLAVTIFIAITIKVNTSADIEKSFRDSAFQVVSIVSTTGFVTADYEKWAPFSRYVFFILLSFGACAGSTTGGIKFVRLLLLTKNSILELKRLLHPRAVVPVRFNNRAVPPGIITNILAFFAFYMFILVVGALVMSFLGLDFPSALGAAAATLGCVGPGIGSVGPVNNFAAIPDLGKWVLSLLMLLGRLEIFTVFVIFAPSFWKA